MQVRNDQLSDEIRGLEMELMNLCDAKAELADIRPRTESQDQEVARLQLEMIRKDNEIKAKWMENNR